MTPETFGELLLEHPGLDRDEFTGAVIGQIFSLDAVPQPEFIVELDNGEEFTITITKTREAS